jgi:hypothetical protein
MSKPLHDAHTKECDPKFEELLKDLPPDLLELAYKCKAFVRARKVQTSAELMRMVFSYCGLDQSLREVGGSCALRGGEKLCDESVKGRLLACQGWIESLLKQLLPEAAQAKLPSGYRWVVCDGSTVQAPGGRTTHYRLHLSLDLVQVRLLEVKVTDHKTGESLAQFDLGRGDAAIADRIYATAKQIVETKQRGSELVLRMSAHNLPLFDLAGQRVKLEAHLRQCPDQTLVTLPAWIKAPDGSGQVGAWVHAVRLNERDAEQARRRLRAMGHKHGRTPKAETLFFAGWVLIVTTLAPEELSGEAVVELYRLRWQVELVIKRLKSLFDLDALRARRGSKLAQLWLHGKLLYALLIEGRARKRVGASWARLDAQRKGSWWRIWKLIAAEVNSIILGAAEWGLQQWKECLSVLAERPRERKLQTLPKAVIVLLHHDPLHS